MVKYKDAIAKSVPYLKEEINKSSDKTIRILIDDIKTVLGTEFIQRHPSAIYWGLKAVLIREGIVVDKGKSVTGEDLLIMKMATPEDWYNIAQLTADIMTGHHLHKWEYPSIIGDNPDRWREFVIEHWMTVD